MTATETQTMSAWTQYGYGAPDIVTHERIAVPSPGPGELLLRVRVTSLNAADAHVMRGDPLLLRLAFGIARPRVAVRGMDVAATVVEIGDGVTEFEVGDEVVGELAGGGGLSEYAVTPAKRMVKRPAALAPTSAAALPLAGGTAWQAVELGGVSAEQRVLVLGASGGVGHFAVQLAALRGAEVWASCGARNQTFVADLGAIRTFDYRAKDAATLPPSSFNVILDMAGTTPLRALKKLLRPGGTLVLVSGEGNRVLGPIGRIIGALFVGIGGRRRIRPLAAVAKTQITSALAELAAQERLTPAIERTFAFDEAGAALEHIDAGRTVGKIVVQVERAYG